MSTSSATTPATAHGDRRGAGAGRADGVNGSGPGSAASRCPVALGPARSRRGGPLGRGPPPRGRGPAGRRPASGCRRADGARRRRRRAAHRPRDVLGARHPRADHRRLGVARCRHRGPRRRRPGLAVARGGGRGLLGAGLSAGLSAGFSAAGSGASLLVGRGLGLSSRTSRAGPRRAPFASASSPSATAGVAVGLGVRRSRRPPAPGPRCPCSRGPRRRRPLPRSPERRALLGRRGVRRLDLGLLLGLLLGGRRLGRLVLLVRARLDGSGGLDDLVPGRLGVGLGLGVLGSPDLGRLGRLGGRRVVRRELGLGPLGLGPLGLGRRLDLLAAAVLAGGTRRHRRARRAPRAPAAACSPETASSFFPGSFFSGASCGGSATPAWPTAASSSTAPAGPLAASVRTRRGGGLGVRRRARARRHLARGVRRPLDQRPRRPPRGGRRDRHDPGLVADLARPRHPERRGARRGRGGEDGALRVGQQRAQAPADGGERHAQRGVLDHEAPDDVDDGPATRWAPGRRRARPR